MIYVPVGRALDAKQRTELEQRLERRLGLVSCVRHPPAIDGVRVTAAEKEATIVVSACCELTSRRAKILIAEVLGELQRSSETGPIS